MICSFTRRLCVLTLALAGATAVGAVEPILVADLAPGETVVDALRPFPNPAVPFGGGFLFAARSPTAGLELWRSDGSEAGTALVVDLCPGPCDANPSDLVAARDFVYFAAVDRDAGERWLYRTDGTREGTLPVYGSCPGGRCFEAPRPLVATEESLLFTARAGSGLLELWRTDGTRSGTLPIALPTRCRPIDVDEAKASGGRFFVDLRCRDGGEALWVVDGAVATDLRRGSDIWSLMPLADGTLAYLRTWNHQEIEILATDGTRAGTVRLASPSSCGPPAALVGEATPGRLLLATGPRGLVLPLQPRCLWSLAADALYGGPEPPRLYGDGSSQAVVELDVPAEGGTAFFLVAEPEPGGGAFDVVWSLGRTDGTPAGTQAAVPIGAAGWFVRLGDALLYAGDDGLYRSDGTPAGTSRISPGSMRAPTRVGERVYFAGEDELGLQPWISDGTAAGTRRLAAVGLGPASSEPAATAALGERLLFAAGAGLEAALWAVSGGALDRLSELSGRPTEIFVDGDRALAGAADFGFARPSLVATDGTPAGTSTLSADGIVPHGFARFGDSTYFAAGPFWQGAELWRTDGTAAGTGLFLEIAPGDVQTDPPFYFSSDPGEFLELAGRLTFAAWSEDAGRELWTSDGTAAGTSRLKDLCPGSCGASPAELTPVPGLAERALFAATSAKAGRELYRTDGTFAGTRRLADLVSGPSGSAPHGLVGFAGAVYFFAREADGGEALWRSDGSEAGTVRVRRLRFQGEIGRASPGTSPVVVGDRLFFVVEHPATGVELWVSDGTGGGTRLVRDLDPGPSSSRPGDLVAVDGLLLFAAENTARGRELWASDGSRRGTRRLTDLAPGPASSSPAAIAAAGDRVVFRADDGSTGGELWTIDRGELPAAVEPE